MNKLNLYFLFPFSVLVLLIVVLSTSMYQLPPLGKFLSPFIGVSHNLENSDSEDFYSNRVIEGIENQIDVFFDERKVPHVFTKDNEDLYYAQGYITASLRLWQMDFLSYVSAGRLSEIFGENMLTEDRKQRRLGILSSAKKSLKLIKTDADTYKMLNAYTKGVNTFIEELSYKNYPFEYKFFDYHPEPWTNLKTVLLMKHMGNVLSGYEQDVSMTHLYLALGKDDFFKLYPDFHDHIEPVIQDSIKEPKKINYDLVKDYLKNGFVSSDAVLPKSNYNPKLGSNNWAVSGNKTKSGYPILCNDVHLNLTLPALWLEMQLSSHDMNVYGVTVPGIPSVIIGFNKDISWGVTNGATDIKDWYKLKISNDYKKYEFEGKMIDFEYEVEEIKVKGKELFYDSIPYTIHGPVVMDNNFNYSVDIANYALRWNLHNPSNEIKSFIELNKAKNKTDFFNAIKGFSCPIQNFTFATKTGDIGIIHQGNLAKKWNGQGRFILDGTRADHLYNEYITQEDLPKLINPESNFVFSANQHPTKNLKNSYYNGYYSEVRSNRIKYLLESENNFDIDKMKLIQLDNVNAFAEEALPVLFSMIKDKLTDKNNLKEFEIFFNWKGNYSKESREARFFELFWENVKNNTWDELKRYSFYQNPPDNYVLLDMIIDEPDNKYFDKQGTDSIETATDIVYNSFISACNKMKITGGLEPWSEYNKIDIIHPTNMKSLGLYDVSMPGHPDAINAISKNWGATWRMIVEFDKDRPRAFGIYPGGQSGNIGSKHYDDYVDSWKKGTYFPLNYYLSKKEAKKALNILDHE